MKASELERRFREVGADRYHHRHPFHSRMHDGDLSRGQIQAWALNRYYYQSRIPMKDSALLARADDPEFRRAWRKRISDHDGSEAAEGRDGGISRWLKLAESAGLDPDWVRSKGAERMILPGVRFAVDAYLDLVSRRTLLEAVASSLTELFSGTLMALRIDVLKRLYPYMRGGLEYFEARIGQTREDAGFALEWVLRHARTAEQQELALSALRSKCEILWAQLDAIHFAYVRPGYIPPGAFRPEVR